MAKTRPEFSLKELRKLVDDGAMDLSVKEIREKELPVKELGEIMSLKQLDLSINCLETLPDNFGSSLARLTHLDLSKNRLQRLPGNFGRLSNLEHLDLFDNKLTRLPTSFANLKKLKWVDMKNNPWEDARLQKLAAICITPEGCNHAAKKVVVLMGEIQREEERVKQEKLRIERERAESEKKAAEAEQERQRVQKKQAKDKRKADAQKTKKPAPVAAAPGQSGDPASNGVTKKDQKGSPNGARNVQRQPGNSSGLFSWLAMISKVLFFLAVCLAMALAGMTAIHAKGNYSTENLLDSWGIVSRDALVFFESGKARCLELVTETKTRLEQNYWVERAVHGVTEISIAIRHLANRAWVAVTNATKDFDVQATREKLYTITEPYLAAASKFIREYGPVAHAAVRDSYVWFVKNAYSGVMSVVDGAKRMF